MESNDSVLQNSYHHKLQLFDNSLTLKVSLHSCKIKKILILNSSVYNGHSLPILHRNRSQKSEQDFEQANMMG